MFYGPFLGLSQWVYVRDDMSKGLEIMEWSITVIVVMSRRVMGIQILNSCRWSGGNKTPGVNLVITRFHKIWLITLRHINVLHEDITYIQYYMAKWSYIIKNIKTYQQFSLWTMITFYKLLWEYIHTKTKILTSQIWPVPLSKEISVPL